MKNLTYLFLLIGTLGMIGCAGPQPLSFNPDWKANDTFGYTYTQESDTDVSVMGQDQKTIQKQVMEFDYKIKDKSQDGNTNMDVTIASLIVEQTSPMFSLDYNSKEATGDGQFDKMYGAMVGHSFNLTVDKEGDVTALEGADEMFDNMMKDADIPNIQQMEGSLKAQFGNDAMKQNFSQFSKFLPGKPVKVGESWTAKDTIVGSLGMASVNTYTLKKRSGGTATIEMMGKVASLPDAPPMEMAGMKIKYNLTGTQSGTIEIDEKTGYTLKSDIAQQIGGDMIIEMQGMGEMNAKMKTDSKVILEKK